MTKEALDDDWWVIGNIEAGMYLHWKGDGIRGCFVDCADPEHAERYDTAEEASKAIQEDEDVQDEISTWNKPASPLHVRKGIVVTEAASETGVDYSDAKQRRAQLLYCMDVLMHALNDEEACSPWLCDGVPDATGEKSLTQEQVRPYADLDVDDEDFYRMTGLFIRTLALEGRFSNTVRSDEEVGKAVFT